MKLLRGLPVLCCVALCAGHASLQQSRAISNEGVFAERLAGVRRCLALHAGDEMEVQAVKQRYGKDSFLVARPAGSPKLVAKAALHNTYEALLRGAGCADAADSSSTPWFVDVGTDDDEVLALASSLGCGVSVLDPELKDVRAVDMTRCMNEEPNRPFLVFQVSATNTTNPESLANMTHSIVFGESSNSTGSDAAVKKALDLVAAAMPAKAALLSKPTMLNNIRRKAEETREKEAAVEQAQQAAAAAEKAAAAAKVAAAEKAAAEEKAKQLAAAAVLENGVMLDTVFTKSGETSASVQVKSASGDSVSVNKISVLKITPRSEPAATVKALQGAKKLLESGRVQCLITEMNFDLNTTESFISHVTDLEKLGFSFAHLGSMDYSELEISSAGQYEVFKTDSKQLQELFETYKRIRSFDERSGFRVYSGSLSLDRKGHYFDYTDLVFACKGSSFPEKLSVLDKGDVRFRNGVWWIERQQKK